MKKAPRGLCRTTGGGRRPRAAETETTARNIHKINAFMAVVKRKTMRTDAFMRKITAKTVE